MYRSFTQRILGGVCGGLAADFHINIWTLRLAFMILALVSQGTAALLYLALWWTMPQESPIEDRRRSIARLLWLIIVVAVFTGIWVGHLGGWLTAASGQNLFVPALLLATSAFFWLGQLRG